MIMLVLAASLLAPQAPDEPVPASARKRTAEDRAAYTVDFDVPPRIKTKSVPVYPPVALTEKVEGVINIVAERLEPLPLGATVRSRDFR